MTIELTDEQKAKAMDWIRKLHADPPWDTMSNPCAGDGYFAKSIVQEFGMSITELGQVCGYTEWKKNQIAAYERYRKEIGV